MKTESRQEHQQHLFGTNGDMTVSSQSSWPLIPLADCIEIRKEQSIPPHKWEEYVALENLESGEIRPTSYGTSAGVLSNCFVYRKGDILYGKLRPYLDKAIIADTEGICSTELLVARSKEVVVNRFILYHLHSEGFLRYAVQHSFGTKMPRVSAETIRRYEILLPPLPEQQKIASVLGIVDEAIAATDSVIAHLEVGRESTCRKLLTQGIGHTEFNSTRLGSYPKAWHLASLGDIAEIGSGATLGRKITGSLVQLPYLRVANVQDGYLDLSTVKYIDILESEREKWLLKVGDILLTEGGDWDKLGRGTIWNGEIESCIHQNHIFRLRLTDPAFDVRFVIYLLSSFFGKAYFKQASKQSTNLASINQKQLRDFVVLQPPLEEQRQIAAILSAFDDRLVALKKGLMQVLLTGKVRVPPGVVEEVNHA